jgi:hypothetical protein
MAVISMGLLPISSEAQTSLYTYSPSLTDWSYTFNIQQFNNSWGTLQLTSVTLTLVESGSMNWELRNNSPSTAKFTLGGTLSVSLDLPGTLDLATSTSYPTSTLFLGSGATMTASSGTLTSSTSITYDASSYDLSAFIGSGTLALAASGTAVTDAPSTTGNTVEIVTTYAGATVEVTYNFAPIPEPSSLALAASGLGLLAWNLRRRK